MFSKKERPVVIIGGAGKTGRRVDALLRARGVSTRLASRSSAPAFDWKNPKTWDGAIKGASALYVNYQPDLAVPEAAAQVAELAHRARKHGIGRLVLLSGRGEDGAVRAEEAARASGVGCVILRASWFAQNFSEGAFLDGVLSGELGLPAGDVREPFVDADDIAEVAAAALTDDRHLGQLYELTGPRSLTFAEAVAEIAAVSGRQISYAQVPFEAFASGAREAGLEEEVIWLLGELFNVVLDGRNERPVDGIRRALGRAPRDFTEYARAAAATGVWRAAS